MILASNVITSTPGFPRSLEDIGEFQGAKILLIFFYCLQAIWCRFRHGVENFYYVPAPGKKRRALPRLAGDVPLPSVFQARDFALARRRAGQVAGNFRANPRARHDLPAVPSGGFEHRVVALQPCRRGKTFVASHLRRSTTALPTRARILKSPSGPAAVNVSNAAKNVLLEKQKIFRFR